MDRTNSQANIKDKNLNLKSDELISLERNLNKDDFNYLNHLVDNEYTKYHWKFPHEQIKEQLTEEELKKFGSCCTVELTNKMVDITKEYLKDKSNEN